MSEPGESQATPQLEDLHLADAPATRDPSPEPILEKSKEKEGDQTAQVQNMMRHFEKQLAELGKTFAPYQQGEPEKKPLCAPKTTKCTNPTRPPQEHRRKRQYQTPKPPGNGPKESVSSQPLDDRAVGKG